MMQALNYRSKTFGGGPKNYLLKTKLISLSAQDKILQFRAENETNLTARFLALFRLWG